MKTTAEYPRLRVRGEQGRYQNFCIRKKKLGNYDLHWHECFEIELVLSGAAFQELNGVGQQLTRGDIYLLNPTDFHRVQGNDALVYNIMFEEEFLSEGLLQKILTVDRNLLCHLDEEELTEVIFFFDSMLREFQCPDTFSEEYIGHALACIFVILLRKVDGFSENERNHGLKQALLYLHRHFRENPSMAQTARQFGFNTNYFSTAFHQFTGKTFKNYLNLLKLQHAQKLLLSGDMTVTEIGFAAGYASLPNFLRCFKAYFGISPGMMRKQHSHKDQEDDWWEVAEK